MSTVVTELTIDADGASRGAEQYSRAMESAAKSTDGLASSLQSMSVAIAAGVAGIVALMAGLRSGVDYVGGINKQFIDLDRAAERAGMSLKTFQQQLFAARSSGVSEKDFFSGMDKMGSLLTDAGRGATEFGKLMQANGVSIRNASGELKSQKQIMTDLAGLVLNASPQVAEGIRRITGLSREWIEHLRQGAPAIDAIAQQVEKAGAIVDEATVAKAREFNKEWNAAVAAWDLQLRASLAGILPLLQQLATIAIGILNAAGSVTEFVSRASTPVDQQSVPQMEKTLKEAEELRSKMVELNMEGNKWLEWKNDYAKERLFGDKNADLAAADAAIAKLKELIKTRKEAADGATKLRVNGASTTVLPPGAQEQSDAIDRMLVSLNRHTQMQLADAAAVGLGARALAEYRAEAAFSAAQTAAGTKATDAQVKEFLRLKKEAGDAAAELERVKDIQQYFGAASNAATSFLKDIATGVKPLEAMEKAAKSLASSIVDIAAKKVASNLLGSLLGDTASQTAGATTSAGILTTAGASVASAMITGATTAAGILAGTITPAAAALVASGTATGTAVGAGGAVAGTALAAGGTTAGTALWGPIALLAAALAALGALSFMGGDEDDTQEQELQRARDSWRGMASDMRAFSDAADGLKIGEAAEEINQLNRTMNSLVEAAARAGDLAGIANVQNIRNRGITRIITEFVSGTQELSDLDQSLADLRNEARSLNDALDDLGLNTAETAAAINDSLVRQLDALRNKFIADAEEGLRRDINSARGVGYVNDIADALTKFDELSSQGVSGGLLSDWLTATVQSIVKGADLSGPAIQDLIVGFPQLASILQETASAVGRSVEELARGTESLQDRLFRAVTDSATLEGQLALFDRTALREREEEIRNGGQLLNDLVAAQEAERFNIIRDYNQKAIDDQKRAAEEFQTFMSGFTRRITEFLDGLRAGSNSPLSPSARLAAAQSQYNAQLALAQGGNRDALNGITQYASDLLEAAKGYFASSSGFQTIFQQIEAQLGGLPSQVSDTQYIVNAIDAMKTAVVAAFGTGNLSTIANTLSMYLPQIDSNGDQAITYSEMVAALGGTATPYSQQIFNELDVNGDGMIQKQELTRAEVSLNNSKTDTSNAQLVIMNGALATLSDMNLKLQFLNSINTHVQNTVNQLGSANNTLQNMYLQLVDISSNTSQAFLTLANRVMPALNVANANRVVPTAGTGSPLPAYAMGTDFARGGWSLVGERGPEIVNLPTGAQVIPNHRLPAFANDDVVAELRALRTLTAALQAEIKAIRNNTAASAQGAREMVEELRSSNDLADDANKEMSRKSRAA